MENYFKMCFIFALGIMGPVSAMELTKSYYGSLNVSREASQSEIIESFNNNYKLYRDFINQRSLLGEKTKPKHIEMAKTNFRKNVIAFFVLTNPPFKEEYDKNSASFEEPFHLYSMLNIPVQIEQSERIITPKQTLRFFTKISPTTIGRAMIDAKVPNEETYERLCEAYLTLSDEGLRALYHKNPTKTSFENALKTYQIPSVKSPNITPRGGSFFKRLIRTESGRKSLTLNTHMPKSSSEENTNSTTLE